MCAPQLARQSENRERNGKIRQYIWVLLGPDAWNENEPTVEVVSPGTFEETTALVTLPLLYRQVFSQSTIVLALGLGFQRPIRFVQFSRRNSAHLGNSWHLRNGDSRRSCSSFF